MARSGQFEIKALSRQVVMDRESQVRQIEMVRELSSR